MLPVPALANGAMSLALTTFGWIPWFAYVLVTIVFEAAALGKWLHIPFTRAIKVSLGANFLTAVLGGFISGFICAILGLYGGRLNPNPFGQTLILFTVFGILSSLVEAYFWIGTVDPFHGMDFLPKGPTARSSRKVLGRCLVVHLVGIPVGLAVLLIPPRPYPGLEAQVYVARVYDFGERTLAKSLELYIDNHQAMPPVHSYRELIQLLKPDLGEYAHNADLWTAAYSPDYHRFDTGERRRDPIEWNVQAIHVKLEDAPDALWLIRIRHSYWCEGLVWRGGQVKRSTDPQELGYTAR